MLHNKVAEGRRENPAPLWLKHTKFVIRLWLIGAGVDLVVQRSQVAGQVLFELKTGALAALVSRGGMVGR